jgi:hypothetical protein
MTMSRRKTAVKICNPQVSRAETGPIVDVSSMYAWIRRERLETIGVEHSKAQKLRGRAVIKHLDVELLSLGVREPHHGQIS